MNDANTALRLLGQLNPDGRLNGLAARLGRNLDERLQGRVAETAQTLQAFSRLAPP